VHSGGAINDVLPAYLAVALLAGLALGNGTGRSSSGRSSTGRLVTTVAGVLILAQSVFLLASSHPSRALPASAGRAVGMRLIAGMRALGGDVAVPGDPSMSLQAGMAPAAVQGAAYDVMRATSKAGSASYRHSAAAAVKARQFSAIISSGNGKALYNPPGLLTYYQECLQSLPAGPGTLLFPAGRSQPRPAVVWIPRGGSCQHTLSILSGGKAPGS
jgi:hypothetical protein